MIALKRKCFLTLMALTMGAMLLLPGVVWGGVWLGVQVGPGYNRNKDIVQRTHLELGQTYENVKFDVNCLGGLTLGYDFADKDSLGSTRPSWMKYFSLALDATYEEIRFQHQWVTVAAQGNFQTPARTFLDISPSGTISIFSLTTMFIGKYGFIRNAEIPFGRLQPYLGLGVGLLISNAEVSGLTTLEKNKLDLSRVVEGGLRYMFSQNISLDAALRYRMIATNFGNSYNAPGDTKKIDLDWDPELYNAILRLSYHF